MRRCGSCWTAPGLRHHFQRRDDVPDPLDWPTVDAAYDFTPTRRSSTSEAGTDSYSSLCSPRPRVQGGPAGAREARRRGRGPPARRRRPRPLPDRARVVLRDGTDDGDLYVLRRVVHDFDDGQAIELLRTLRGHMPPEPRCSCWRAWCPRETPALRQGARPRHDALRRGSERTERQFATLLDRAGFRLTRVIPTVSTISLVEAARSRGHDAARTVSAGVSALVLIAVFPFEAFLIDRPWVQRFLGIEPRASATSTCGRSASAPATLWPVSAPWSGSAWCNRRRGDRHDRGGRRLHLHAAGLAVHGRRGPARLLAAARRERPRHIASSVCRPSRSWRSRCRSAPQAGAELGERRREGETSATSPSHGRDRRRIWPVQAGSSTQVGSRPSASVTAPR